MFLKNTKTGKLLAALLLLGALFFAAYRYDLPISFYLSAGWLIIISLLVWWGNRFLTVRLDKILPWSRFGSYRFFIHLIIGLAYLLMLMNLSYYLLKILITNDGPTVEQFIVMNVYGAFIFIPSFSIYFSLHFLKHWRKSELDAERYQKDSMRSQLESLKHHLDPHFLFNNLNILSALIETDPKKSRRFIEKFADVYRTLLRKKADDLILLTEELEFIDSYMYLISTRFENLIQFSKELKPGYEMKMIPPATLQLLLENAIKHNVISDAHPLEITVAQTDNNYLIVKNTLREKLKDTPDPGSGLENIKNRYSHFTDRVVSITKTETHFEVHVPLLEPEQW